MVLGRCAVNDRFEVRRIGSRFEIRGSSVEGKMPLCSNLKPRTSNLAILLAVTLSACSWFTDFKEQPSYHPWKTASDTVPPRANPQSSVSVYGTAAPGFIYRSITDGCSSRSIAPSATAPWDAATGR
jgi:hypothetical protein